MCYTKCSKIKFIVDECAKELSYIAQSRAMYKIIYSHPPKGFKDSDFKEHSEIRALLGPVNLGKGRTSPLEKLLILHQDLHFGKAPMDENKIKNLIAETLVNLGEYLEVKCLDSY
jgi:hypothetical protein